jgi:hypothetical protein
MPREWQHAGEVAMEKAGACRTPKYSRSPAGTPSQSGCRPVGLEDLKVRPSVHGGVIECSPSQIDRDSDAEPNERLWAVLAIQGSSEQPVGSKPMTATTT